MSQQPLAITVGPELFTFMSFEAWRYCAKARYDKCGHPYRRTIAIDSKGSIVDCSNREQVEAAAYPIRVYAIDTEASAGGASA